MPGMRFLPALAILFLAVHWSPLSVAQSGVFSPTNTANYDWDVDGDLDVAVIEGIGAVYAIYDNAVDAGLQLNPLAVFTIGNMADDFVFSAHAEGSVICSVFYGWAQATQFSPGPWPYGSSIVTAPVTGTYGFGVADNVQMSFTPLADLFTVGVTSWENEASTAELQVTYDDPATVLQTSVSGGMVTVSLGVPNFDAIALISPQAFAVPLFVLGLPIFIDPAQFSTAVIPLDATGQFSLDTAVCPSMLPGAVFLQVVQDTPSGPIASPCVGIAWS